MFESKRKKKKKIPVTFDTIMVFATLIIKPFNKKNTIESHFNWKEINLSVSLMY